MTSSTTRLSPTWREELRASKGARVVRMRGARKRIFPTGGHLAAHPILYKALRRYRGCPWNLSNIVAAALVLLHHENHRTT
jgi:hypothetical protein